MSEAQVLGRYELVESLGHGGMGEVYLAKITGAAGFEKPCIVKTILPSLLSDAQFLDRFHHEAKVLVHLVHSNIAQVYDMGQAGSTYYMALEYVAGVDLAVLREQAQAQGLQIPVPVALFIGKLIAEGLGYAHRKTGPDGTPLNVVHRDVSPQNVMVSYEGEVKVIDFGLAKSSARSKHTMTPTVMGKLGYMSPEQARASTVDHRSDIYSAGVVVWELLAGRQLIPNGTVGEMVAAMTAPKVPSLMTLRPEVDGALDAVVQRALAARPEDRYARADDFARALNEHLFRSGTPLGAEEVGNYVRTLCPDAFAAQRRLLSKLSSVKRKTPLPSPPPAVDSIGLAATALRQPTPTAPTPMTPVAAPPGTSQLVPTPSRGPWIALVLLAIVAAASVTGWVVSRHDAKQELADLEKVREQVAPGEPVAPAIVPTAASSADAGAATAIATDKLTEPAHRDAGHPRHVASVAGSVEYVSPKAVEDIFSDRGGVYARAGSADRLRVGANCDVVGFLEGGHRRKFGTATVLEVSGPHLARLSLDPNATQGSGRKFVALPDAPATTPAPAPEDSPPNRTPPAPPSKPSPKALHGRSRSVGTPRILTVFNDENRAWNDCYLVLPSKRLYFVGKIAPHASRAVLVYQFTKDSEAREVEPRTVGVDCHEGSGEFSFASKESKDD